MQACLLKGYGGHQAWNRWRAQAQLPISSGLHRLLPAVYWNLRDAVSKDHWLDMGKAEYLRARYRNLLQFDDAAPLMGDLKRAGIDVLLLKGAALVAAHYPDPGLRPMVDLDVLVRPTDVERTIAALAGRGYEPAVSVDQTARAFAHSAPFAREGAVPIDLHWRSVEGDAEDEAFWERAVDVRFSGVDIRVPSPADLLLNACIQGQRWDWDAPQRWVLDAMTVVRSSGARLDWSRLIERARARRAASSARDALDYLRATFEADIPQRVLATLATARVSVSERLADRARRVRPDLRGPVLIGALRLDDYRRLARSGAVTPGPIGLLEVWRRAWNLDHFWQLPPQAARRGARRLWQMLRHRLKR
ncbi:MAG: nucleotidyltransferase family protein [Vicinamibacteria bacterium]|nr:nucleotidyltransferase family protein [Vicinamibacteria bacterium]